MQEVAMVRQCSSCGAKNRIPPARLDQQARCGKCKTPLSPIDAPVEVGSSSELQDLIDRSPVAVLVDFWAPWCGPCRVVAPELAKLAHRNVGRVVVAKVDVDALPDAAARHGVRGVPTMVLFRDGREAHRISGAAPAGTLSAQLGL
jgi:thioredoxin 2